VQVLDHRIEVEALEFLGVVEVFPHRVGPVETLQAQLVRPPVAVRKSRVHDRAFARAIVGFRVHRFTPIVFWFFPLGIQGSPILGK
jgi:hypothetical protein